MTQLLLGVKLEGVDVGDTERLSMTDQWKIKSGLVTHESPNNNSFMEIRSMKKLTNSLNSPRDL